MFILERNKIHRCLGLPKTHLATAHRSILTYHLPSFPLHQLHVLLAVDRCDRNIALPLIALHHTSAACCLWSLRIWRPSGFERKWRYSITSLDPILVNAWCFVCWHDYGVRSTGWIRNSSSARTKVETRVWRYLNDVGGEKGGSSQTFYTCQDGV